MKSDKTVNILIACSILLLTFTSCYDDKGNYDYVTNDQLMSVEIGALDSVSTKANSQLTITPTLKNDDASRYTYCWYTMNKEYPYDVDTLSHQRDLSIVCNLPVGDYTLYYQVKDSVKNIYKSTTAALSVTATDITTGWYVLKTINGGVDFDYYPLKSTVKNETNMLKDVLNLTPLTGTPVSILYVNKAYSHSYTNPDGTTTLLNSQSALHIVTNDDMITLNASDMSVFKTLNEEFYEKPTNINFQSLQKDAYNSQMLINDNHLHTVGSIGKFGYQEAGGYKFCPDIVCGYYQEAIYDQTSMCMYTMYFGSSPEVLMNFNGSTVFADSTFLMKHMYTRTIATSYKPSLYGIGQNQTSGKYYIVYTGAFSSYLYPTPVFTEISSTCGLLASSVITVPTGPSVFYYADSNKLMVHKVATGEESTLKTFESNEKITFMKNITGKDGTGTSFNDLVVVTTSSGNYKIYLFPLVGSAGEIDATSAAAMTGTGEASFVMFRNN
jgi:hypothetical protein